MRPYLQLQQALCSFFLLLLLSLTLQLLSIRQRLGGVNLMAASSSSAVAVAVAAAAAEHHRLRPPTLRCSAPNLMMQKARAVKPTNTCGAVTRRLHNVMTRLNKQASH
jgi:hypothetical protein